MLGISSTSHYYPVTQSSSVPFWWEAHSIIEKYNKVKIKEITATPTTFTHHMHHLQISPAISPAICSPYPSHDIKKLTLLTFHKGFAAKVKSDKFKKFKEA